VKWRHERVITTNYVLGELVALLGSRTALPRSEVLAFVRTVRESLHVELIHVAPPLDAARWEFLEQRQDKSWSLTDAVSFLVMQERGMSEALTTDHHFEQAGFVTLLR